MSVETVKAAKPEIVTEEMMDFLDDLRESGDTNMFGAAPYLQDEFGLERRDAKAVLVYWMESFAAYSC